MNRVDWKAIFLVGFYEIEWQKSKEYPMKKWGRMNPKRKDI